MNDNQNYFVAEGRTTSRVINPPGGKCSISLGTDEPVKPTAPAKKQDQEENSEPEPPKQDNQITKTQNDDGQPVSANAFASGANMNGANVMTGRPTSRVLAPPGGHSSISLW